MRVERTASSLISTSLAAREKMLALFGEDQAAGVAVEEGDAEVLLQGADLPAHRRLAHVELLAGMGEGAGLGGGVEDPELVPVHPAAYSAASADRLRLGEELLGLERRHAAQAGGGHRLAEDLVGDVAGGEDAGNAGRGRIRLRSRCSRSASS